MNKRTLNLQKYGISGKRYKELCGYCEQYPEWKAKIFDLKTSVKSPIITDMPGNPNHNSNSTEDIAIKRTILEQNISLIEDTAKQAAPDMWQYLIDGICYELPITYLINIKKMPISSSAYYEYRRYFFYLLDKNKQNTNIL